MIKRLALVCDNALRRYTPDPFIYALLLTAIVYLWSCLKLSNLVQPAFFWGQGFWSLTGFTMQMVMILFMGYVAALSPPVKWMLKRSSLLPKNLAQASAFSTLLALLGSMLNWGFGLIISALFCKEIGKRFKGHKFAILVACSYAGFLIWHGGFSGSIPLLVATPNNFTQTLVGGVTPLSKTIFSNINLFILLGHFILLPILSFFMIKFGPESKSVIKEDESLNHTFTRESLSPSDKLENSSFLSILLFIIAAIYLTSTIVQKKFSLNLNEINFILFIFAVLLHKTPRAFLDACLIASGKIWPILVQYPLYAGIMAIMQQGGIAEQISQWFVTVSTKETLSFMVYLSAGLVNVFIPSGGGQWAIQGPMVLSAAKQLGANIEHVILAVSWGDAWTNMIQPFWALPLLAIAGLKVRDIMSYLVIIFLLSGMITSFCLLFFG